MSEENTNPPSGLQAYFDEIASSVDFRETLRMVARDRPLEYMSMIVGQTIGKPGAKKEASGGHEGEVLIVSPTDAQMARIKAQVRAEILSECPSDFEKK